MATAMVRKRVPQPANSSWKSRPGAEPTGLRLLFAERSEEIFPILLEEIIGMGIPRALVLTVDFETGEIQPAAALKCSKRYLQRFRTSLWAGDDPVVSTLHNMQPAVLPGQGLKRVDLYCHPVIYKNQNLCWEAQRQRRGYCLAAENFRSPRKLQLSEQVCGSCGMRGYAAAVVAELPPHMPDVHVRQLRSIIDLANRYLTRLFKVEHYYNRVRY